MKHVVFLLLAWAITGVAAAQGYSITVSYKPVEKGYLYLGCYFGDKKYVQDSAVIQPNGTVVFTGKEPLVGGLYLIADEQKRRYFDLLIDREQTIALKVDTTRFVLKSVSGSSENNYLEQYQQATARYFRNYQQWETALAQSKTKADSTRWQDLMKQSAMQAQAWRDSFCNVQSESYLCLLFRLMKEPGYNVKKNATRQDSILAFQQYKQAYWQDIPVNDERLLRTPMFEQRISNYFNRAVYQQPDSVKKETDRFILYSRTNKTMFRYYINRFTNEFMNPKIMGMDAVFLHLFEKYYLTNQVDWLEPKDKELVYNRAYSIMGNLVGEPAAELNMLDTTNKPVNLYSIKAPYTLLVFWDPDCGHCREQVPVIDSLYHNRWKQHGLKVAGILVDSVRTDASKLPLVKAHWQQYISTHRLQGWLHLYQSFEARELERKNRIPGFRQNYDVIQTPTIYLLDKDKRIIAKKITPEQVTDFLQHQQQKNQTILH